MTGGGSTNWFISIPAMIARIETMNPGQAGADAAGLAKLLNDMFSAAGELASGFAGDDLEGEGATSSQSAARDIFGDISKAAADAAPGVSALTAAQSVMENAHAQIPKLQAMQAGLRDNPFISAMDTMFQSMQLMTETYNPPMSAAAAEAPSPPSSALDASGSAGGGAGGGGGVGSSGGGSGGVGGTRMSAGNSSDMGEYGGAPQDPKPTAKDAEPAPSGSGPSQPTASNPASSPQDSPTARPASDDSAGGLNRGGHGDADGYSPFTTTPAAFGGIGAGDKPLSLGGRGGGAGGGGGGFGGGGAVSELTSRPSVGASSTTAPGASGTPMTSASARAGASPTGAAPHGAGRGKAGEDSKHKTAHYLHTRDNGEEIVGDLPLVGPPVIGDWAPPAPAADEAPQSVEKENPDKPLTL